MKLSVKIVSFIMLYWSLMPEPIIAQDCEKHKIYCSILKINPKVDKDMAFKLSNYLSKYSKKYGTNPYRSVAIIAQESMFRHVDSEDGRDIGIFQFNLGTIKAYKMDALRLQFDLEYATHEHVKLLAKKKEYCQEIDEPWSCYHSSNERQRREYVKAVSRYYDKIEIIKEGE